MGLDFISVKAKQANKNERMAVPNSNILPINPLDPLGWVVGCSAAPCTEGAMQQSHNHQNSRIFFFLQMLRMITAAVCCPGRFLGCRPIDWLL